MSNFIAHRGLNSKKYSENTKEAILDSLKYNYIKGIEIDVRMTKDKKIVVIHDSTINRTSNGSGFVKNMTLRELRKYNFGTDKNPSKISTLNEILNLIPNNKLILIELKSDKKQDTNIFIRRFYNIIRKYKNKNIYIASFNEKLIKKLKAPDSSLKCSVFISKIINSEHIDDTYDFTIVSSYGINTTKNYKKPIFIWAIYNKKQYLDLTSTMDKDVLYIVDYPCKFL